jgi:ATP-dependent protease ClpP protease subunit
MARKSSVLRREQDSQPDIPVVFDKASMRIDIFCRISPKTTLDVHSILKELGSLKGNGSGGNRKRITVAVNTHGGEALQGLAIYDLLRSCGLDVTTVVLGEVASSGLAVVLAGKERLMYQNAILHFHQTAMEFEKGKSIRILRQEEVERERAQIRIVDALYAKITLENSRISLRRLRALERQDTYVMAEQALKMGFVNGLIGHPEPQTP